MPRVVSPAQSRRPAPRRTAAKDTRMNARAHSLKSLRDCERRSHIMLRIFFAESIVDAASRLARAESSASAAQNGRQRHENECSCSFPEVPPGLRTAVIHHIQDRLSGIHRPLVPISARVDPRRDGPPDVQRTRRLVALRCRRKTGLRSQPAKKSLSTHCFPLICSLPESRRL